MPTSDLFAPIPYALGVPMSKAEIADMFSEPIAAVDGWVRKGALQIAEVPGENRGNVTLPADGVGAVNIPPKDAKPIVANLEDAGDLYGYGDDEINAVRHWICCPRRSR